MAQIYHFGIPGQLRSGQMLCPWETAAWELWSMVACNVTNSN